MKSRKISLLASVGLLAIAIATGAIAADKSLGDGDDNWLEHAKSTKTRVQVVAELNEARAQGLLNYDDSSYPILPQPRVGRSRAEVVAELNEARAQGLLDYTDSDYPILPK